MDGTRDLHDHELDAAAKKSLGSAPVAAANGCAFCSLPSEYALRGKHVCRECAGEIYRLYRRNKRLREAQQHGVVGSGTPEAARLREMGRRRA